MEILILMQATYNQSFFDLAAMATGTIEAAFDIAAAAGMSLSDDPIVGVDYAVPKSAPMQEDVVHYLVTGRHIVATQENSATGIGLGIMSIGSIYKLP